MTDVEDDATRALGARIKTSWIVLVAIRAIESLIVGASAGALAIAAVIAAGGSGSVFDARAAAGMAAIFAAAAWWLEHAPDVAYVVRRIDRAESWSGELVTAYEIGRRHVGRASEIERLLGRRVLEKLPLRACLRAVAPRSVALLALPLVGAAVLLFAIDRGPDAGADDAIGSSGMQAAIGSLASASHSLRSAAKSAASSAAATEGTQALFALADAIEKLDRDLRTRALSPREADAALADAAARLHAAVSASSTDPATSDSLARAERALADARTELARAGDASSSAGPSSADHALPSTSGSGEPNSASSVSTGAASNPSPVAPEIPSVPNDEQGTSGGRWWSQRYDVVVQRWVESLRKDGVGREDGTDRPRIR
jgi:hypothetical protein